MCYNLRYARERKDARDTMENVEYTPTEHNNNNKWKESRIGREKKEIRKKQKRKTVRIETSYKIYG